MVATTYSVEICRCHERWGKEISSRRTASRLVKENCMAFKLSPIPLLQAPQLNPKQFVSAEFGGSHAEIAIYDQTAFLRGAASG